MIKIKRFILIFVLLLIPIYSCSTFAQDTACIENASTNEGVDKCGDKLVPPKEKRIEGNFNRLLKKYEKNEEVKVLLLLVKKTWRASYPILCNFEGAVAANGQISGKLPVEANKVFLKCIIREFDEIEAVLKKF